MGWAIALHGGAGDIPLSLPRERRLPREAGLRHCLHIGVEALKANTPALDVVELVVIKLSTVLNFNFWIKKTFLLYFLPDHLT